MIIILHEYKCPSWNILYSGKHWSKRQEMAEYAHLSVMEALAGQKWTPYTFPVNIRIEAHLKREIDPDNICAKLLIDGLKLEGIIKDDSPKYVKAVTTVAVKDKKDYTDIFITPCE